MARAAQRPVSLASGPPGARAAWQPRRRLVPIVACTVLFAAACGPGRPGQGAGAPCPARAASSRPAIRSPLDLPDGAMRWTTMRAEHMTVVTARRRDGSVESARLRGLFAAARPDSLRLRVLGPAGVTLFDLVGRDGRCAVLEGLPTGTSARDEASRRVLEALCHDLRAAFRLGAPPPGNRSIGYGDWRAQGSSLEPFRIRIEDRDAGFTAEITVGRLLLDPDLPPDLFALP